MAAMKISILLIILSTLSITPCFSQNGVNISLKNGTADELKTKDQLQGLLRQYDPSKWAFTNEVIIDERDHPHSHPVLTLHTRYLANDLLLLSTYVHEQIHWGLESKPEATERAIRELRTIYPNAPANPPEGDVNQPATYLHILVGYLEYQAMRELVGNDKATEVMQVWSNRIYKWIYKTILENDAKVRDILKAHRLLAISPSARRPALQLRFIPKSEEFTEAAKEYQSIWNAEGRQISEVMEDLAGLEFVEKEVQVVVHGAGSLTGVGSQPTYLRATYPTEIKRATLIHELGHRLIFRLKNKPIEIISAGEREHKTLFLFLYDLWVKLYGKEFADGAVEVEKKRIGKHDYRLAWSWALSHSESERRNKWDALLIVNR